MTKSNSPSRRRPLAAAAAFAVTLLAMPVSSVLAQSFPQYPLQTGGGDAEPNILFILDDSGSMTGSTMTNPDLTTICRRASNGSCTTSSTFTLSTLAYPSNTLSYNPGVDYSPWLQSSGTPMTGGTSYNAVFTDTDLASGSTGDLATVVRTYYVPKDLTQTGSTYLRNSINYYRFQIRTINGVSTVIRSELMLGGNYGDFPPVETTILSETGIAVSNNNDTWRSFTLTEQAELLTVATTGTDTDADLYVYQRNGSNTGWNLICSQTGSSSNETCSLTGDDARARQYVVRIYADSTFANLTLNVNTTSAVDSGCSLVGSTTYTWGGCSAVLPTPAEGVTRDLAAELRNYATWYSYHRTRMKIAKAGASAAFNQLSNNVRVGFRTIHDRNNLDIPVEDGNEGLFEGTARSNWFDRLFGAEGNSGTPLRGSLDSAGEYFMGDETSGPYGPEAGADQLACRQNFAILTTDGYWNSNFGSIDVGNQDGTNGAAILNPNDGTNVVRYTNAMPYRDGATLNRSETLADVAMKYWKEDLRTDMANIVTPSTRNPAFWQHMVTFGISIGLKGTIDQTTVAAVVRDGSPRIGGSNVSWPDPEMSEEDGSIEIAARIDDLIHAAVNGHGEFVAATSADDFRTALTAVLGQIQARLSSGSNVATNSTSFQSDTRLYQATYTSQQWTGELAAYNVTASAGISGTAAWQVSSRIAATYADGPTNNDFDNRTVLTWGGTAGTGFPTNTQQTALARAGGVAPVTGADNASYIKGNQDLEIANFDEDDNPTALLRNRNSLLGDIINSSPFFVRDNESIFIGANDGMMHSINALTGDVRFSYVPAGVNLARLASLSDPDYQHAFFVDGPLAVSNRNQTADVNYLVGSLGRGGKGVFALDVTTPGSMANADVLWDNTATADDDMGHVFGVPMILRGNNDTVMAIVANGIDSTNGDAVLYMYNMATGALIKKINTGAATGSGLSVPRAADINLDGKVDYVYAGDLLGNVWKFDLSDADPANWVVALGGEPLFTAMDSTGLVAQPITGGLALARESGTDRIWVTFGTGRMFSEGDLDPDVSGVQSFYGIIDGEPILDRDELTTRTVAVIGTATIENDPDVDTDDVTVDVRGFEAYQDLPLTSRGWVIDLTEPEDGERVVSGPRVFGRAVWISSVIPSEGEGCEPSGKGYLNALDLFTGTSPADGGGTGSSSFFDLGGDGSGDDDTVGDGDAGRPIGSVDLGIGMPTESRQIDELVLICGSGGVCESVATPPPGPGEGGDPQRLSWRELISED